MFEPLLNLIDEMLFNLICKTIAFLFIFFLLYKLRDKKYIIHYLNDLNIQKLRLNQRTFLL
jgi:hypothetical protein